MTLQFHGLANLFPLVEGAEFEALVEDIRQHGVRDRIVMLDRQIIDGRNRYRSLVELIRTGETLGDGWGHRAGERLTESSLEPPQLWFEAFNKAIFGDPLAWVISKNLKRRHLDEGQRAHVAAKLANMRHGGDRKSDQAANLQLDPPITQAAAAKLLNVSPRSVASARTVQEQGAPELQHEVEQGRIAVSTAEALASLPKDEQAEIVAKGEKEILEAASAIRARKRVNRFERVSEKLATISEASKPLPTGQQFPIIYADPATRYISGFSNRSIENHYPTMTQDELLALPVGDLAMRDAVLFIWSTVPQLANTMALISAYGFNFVSDWCWDKVHQGTGHWGFNCHEHLLIATRGNFPAPIPGQQPRSIYREAKTGHSSKPAWFAEQIESIWPSLPKIELFARPARPGWHAWGNQSGITYVEKPATRLDEVDESTSASVGCTPASHAAAAAFSSSSKEDDGLDIPEFLRRRPDNSLPKDDAA